MVICHCCTHLEYLRERLGQHAGVCPCAFDGVGLTSAGNPIRHYDASVQSALKQLCNLCRCMRGLTFSVCGIAAICKSRLPML